MVEYEYFLNRYSYTSQLLSSYMKNCNWLMRRLLKIRVYVFVSNT
jgi:hypothetical protein